MCTLTTISIDQYTTNVINQIISDARSNYDGYGLVLMGDSGEVLTILRTLDIDPILTALDIFDWSRMFLHSRFATQGETNILNTHGWSAGRYLYMHNGSLSDPLAYDLPVDSLLIGKWLELGLDVALDQLSKQSFANVFIIDTETGDYHVSRSVGGQLHTDGAGSYSTNPVDTITTPVEPGVETHGETCLYYKSDWYDDQYETYQPITLKIGNKK